VINGTGRAREKTTMDADIILNLEPTTTPRKEDDSGASEDPAGQLRDR
jgi:hypothetical protein